MLQVSKITFGRQLSGIASRALIVWYWVENGHSFGGGTTAALQYKAGPHSLGPARQNVTTIFPGSFSLA